MFDIEAPEQIFILQPFLVDQTCWTTCVYPVFMFMPCKSITVQQQSGYHLESVGLTR